MRHQWWVTVALLLSSVGCDQLSKRAAGEWLEGRAPETFLGDTVRLSYAENTGAFLGLGSSWPELVRFIVFTLLSSAGVVVAAGWLLAKLLQRGQPLAWPNLVGAVLLLAGGVGNLVDRILRNGAVVDFLNLGFGPVRTGIFNLADVQLMLGGAMLIWWSMRGPLRPRTGTARTPPRADGA